MSKLNRIGIGLVSASRVHYKARNYRGYSRIRSIGTRGVLFVLERKRQNDRGCTLFYCWLLVIGYWLLAVDNFTTTNPLDQRSPVPRQTAYLSIRFSFGAGLAQLILFLPTFRPYGAGYSTADHLPLTSQFVVAR